jgi:anion transporter
LPLLLSCGSAALGLALLHAGFSTRQSLAGATISFAMSCWATSALPELTTGLAFFALATLGHIAEPKSIFTGFASSAFWLVLGGMIVAQAITKTGLGRRIAAGIVAPLSSSYARLILGTVLITYLLAFLMPSNIGRIVLLMPIMLAISDQLGLGEGRQGRIGVVLAVGFGTFILSTTILPSNVPNLIMAGSIEGVYGIRLSYFDYLRLHTPLLGLAKAALLVALICRLFPDHLSSPPPRNDEPPMEPMSPAERRLGVLLVATLGLWLTEGLHGIAPAWVGLAAAVICLLPGIGMLSPDAFNSINHRTLLYVAALLGVVTVISETGLGGSFAKIVLAVLPMRVGADAWNFGLLVLLSFCISLVASANAVGAIYTALADDLMLATGFPLMTVLMIQVLGFSTVAFAYQAPPIMVTVGLGNISPSAVPRLGVRMAVVTFAVLVPLDYFWWRFLGMF